MPNKREFIRDTGYQYYFYRYLLPERTTILLELLEKFIDAVWLLKNRQQLTLILFLRLRLSS